MTTFEFWSMLIRGLSALLLFLGLLFTARQLSLLRKTHAEEHEWRRRKAAQDATQSYAQRVQSTRELEATFHYFDREDPVRIEEMLEAFQQKPELKTELHRLLNFYESLARGVSTKVYDENIIRTAWSGPMVRASHKFSLYIAHRRRHVSPKAWLELESITKKWDGEDHKSELAQQYGKIGT